MNSKEDRTRFLLDPVRFEIAQLCRNEALTHADIAGKLGRAGGSLSQPQTMVKHGALEARARPKASDGRRARIYRLKKSWWPALEAARELQRPAWPKSGQDLLVIPLADTAAACAAIAKGIPGIEWAAPVRGGVAGIVLAPSREAGGTARIRALEAMQNVAPRVMSLNLDAPLSGSSLREWASRVAADELPPGR